jgi:hypothetical protein
MTQDDWIILAFKIADLAGFASLTAWIIQYSLHGKWWRNDVGRTLVAKTALIAALLVPAALSLFFHLNRLNSHIVAWVDVCLLGLVTPVMIWRMVVFRKIYRRGQ